MTVAAPSHLTARERARRAARGGASRSVPAPLLAPALIAVGFLVLPLIGLLIRAPWGRIGAALSGADATQALILSLWTAWLVPGLSGATARCGSPWRLRMLGQGFSNPAAVSTCWPAGDNT